MSNISLADIGKVILDDISGATVCRCELKCGAALIANARHFYEVMKVTMRDSRNTGFGLFFHAYRQDATNGREKVVAVELHSAYVSNVLPEEETKLAWHHFNTQKSLSDLGIVGNETGDGCIGVTLRGLKSLGCPSWRDLQSQPEPMQTLTEHIFMVTTDNGPNECAARRSIAAEISGLSNVYFFEQSCLEHGPHLVVMGSLNLADELLEMKGCSWKYWSSLAMFAHAARDVAKPLYQSYAARWGALLAKQSVKAIFPRPIAQRWGRIHELERRIQNADFLKLALCLCEVLTSKWVDCSELPDKFHSASAGSDSCGSGSCNGAAWEAVSAFAKKAVGKPKASAGGAGTGQVEGKEKQKKQKDEAAQSTSSCRPGKKQQQGPHTEISKDQTKEYSIRMGKWRAKTIVCVSDMMWGLCIDIMNRTRSPLIHISNFLKKPVDDEELVELGGPLAQLVFGKAADMQMEFTTMLRDLTLPWFG
eukprot:s1306_g15.t1